jgi:hypothetical protein
MGTSYVARQGRAAGDWMRWNTHSPSFSLEHDLRVTHSMIRSIG